MIDYQSRILEKFITANKLDSKTVKRLRLYLKAQSLTANSCFIVAGTVYIEVEKDVITDINGNIQLFVDKPQQNLLKQCIISRERKQNRLKRWLSQQDEKSIDGKCTKEQLQRRLESRRKRLELERKRRLIHCK